MGKAMTGMRNLVAWISTHKAWCMQTLATVCVCVLGCVSLILGKAGSDWPKNRMLSHSSVSQTHLLLLPRWLLASCLSLPFSSVCPSPIISFTVVGNCFALQEEMKKNCNLDKYVSSVSHLVTLRSPPPHDTQTHMPTALGLYS